MTDFDKKFDEIFDKFNFSLKAEKSTIEFSNWILGISVGISALLISQFSEFDFTIICFSKLLYKGILLFSMLNTFLTGYNKFIILKRNIVMNINLGLLKKTVILSSKDKSKTEETIKKEWDLLFDDWCLAYNKIKRIGDILRYSIITTLTTLILAGVYILIMI